MVMVRPFQGLRYNPRKIHSFGSVLAPPYDVIKPHERDELYEESPYNVVRVILAKEPGRERYETAARTFRDWISKGVLIQDPSPSIYPFYQEFRVEGRKIVRKGFIAVVKIEDFQSKKVLPHEETFATPKEDRLRLTRACNANLSPVFAIYSEPEGSIENKVDELIRKVRPLIHVTGTDGVRHRLWRVSDSGLFDQIQSRLKLKKLLIADGHHRYETALNYRDIRRAESSNGSRDGEYEYVMVYLCRAESEGLIIKPTHRVVRSLGSITAEELINRAERDFTLSKLPLKCSQPPIDPKEFLLLMRGWDFFYKLSPKNLEDTPYRNIAVIRLHRHLLGPVISDEEGRLAYTKSKEEAIAMVKRGDYEAAFLLPPLSAIDVFAIASAGEKMPHKSTYFYPKIPSGLVFHLLE